MTSSRSYLPVLLGLVLILTISASAITASSEKLHKHVGNRIALMNTQKNALTTLEHMSTGRIPFDSKVVRDMRSLLKQTTKAIPKRFRRARMDVRSNADPKIWNNWEDFKLRAELAELAAANLKPRSAASLRKSLPDLINACHSCHTHYRNHVNEFKTH